VSAEGEPRTADETADSIAQFAADLRKLRLDAESPTLAKLQSDTGISRSVLSDAFAGRQLPSARTVDGIVRACGVQPHAWIDRRDALAGRAAVAASAPAASGDTAGAGEELVERASTRPLDAAARPSMSRRAAAWLAAGAFVVGVAASAVTTLVVAPLVLPATPAAAQADEPQAQIAVTTGEDPAATACVDDARVATGDTRADNSLLEIVWSDKCQAGWGRITRYDGAYAGNTVTIAIYPQTSPDGPDRQEATEHDVQGAYTTLVVRPSPDTLLCAEGSYTVDGTRIDLGDPLCI
jgi:DNA-binding phage protein